LGGMRNPASPRADGPIPTALLDIAGVAERLAVTERFVRRLVFERRIPFLKIGHFVRFDPGELERWIATTRVPEDTRR
jgi:excisionase family DNA binding protein